MTITDCLGQPSERYRTVKHSLRAAVSSPADAAISSRYSPAVNRQIDAAICAAGAELQAAEHERLIARRAAMRIEDSDPDRYRDDGVGAARTLIDLEKRASLIAAMELAACRRLDRRGRTTLGGRTLNRPEPDRDVGNRQTRRRELGNRDLREHARRTGLLIGDADAVLVIAGSSSR